MSIKVEVKSNEQQILDCGQMILCLADQQLLNGNQLNEVDDILEKDQIKVKHQINKMKNQKNKQRNHIIVRNMIAKKKKKAQINQAQKKRSLNPSKYDCVGRNKDIWVFKDQEEKDSEIYLVYRDHSGYQCHGKRYLDINVGYFMEMVQKKSELIRQKQKMIAQSEGPLMQVLKEEQKKKGVAHLVIGKKKY